MNCTSFTRYKTVSGSEPRQMQDLDEARGELLQVNLIEGSCVAVFSWGEVALPIEQEARLRELVGRRIGILRLQGYHVKELERSHA
jgi:hypothetical protein